MKSTTKIIGIAILALPVCIFMSGCKSPEAQKTEATTEIIDTASAPVAFDTATVKNKNIPLTVNVTNLKSPDAPVEISVYGTKDKFPEKDGQMKKYRFKPVNGKLEAKLDSIPYGEFAIALYQDENNDGEIDKNALGIPTERYGFSNNFKPLVKAPSFKNCKFEYTAKANTIDVKLLK
ncbi:MAG: DUF2141 domain-containing protein [Bacteroidota bacterium]